MIAKGKVSNGIAMKTTLKALAVVTVLTAPVPSLAAEPAMTVYKSPYCGCCGEWIEYVRKNGISVRVKEMEDVSPVKEHFKIDDDLWSCHTAIIDGYVVEGHVPAYVVRKLLEERPEITGITVPGMPVGSPGMEGPNPKPYQVLAFDRQGNRTVFAEVDPR